MFKSVSGTNIGPQRWWSAPRYNSQDSMLLFTLLSALMGWSVADAINSDVTRVVFMDNVTLPWTNASDYCRREGGRLALLNGELDFGKYFPHFRNKSSAWFGNFARMSPWIADIGCYNTNSIAHNKTIYLGTDNQKKSCLVACARYRYIGLKGTVCICVSTVNYTGWQKPDTCDQRCPGHTGEYCGGSDVLTLYQVYWEDNITLTADRGDCVSAVVDRNGLSYKSRPCGNNIGRICQKWNHPGWIYKVLTYTKTWSSGANNCRSTSHNGVLLNIHNDGQSASLGNHNEFWTGLYRTVIWNKENDMPRSSPVKCLAANVVSQEIQFEEANCTAFKSPLCEKDADIDAETSTISETSTLWNTNITTTHINAITSSTPIYLDLSAQNGIFYAGISLNAVAFLLIVTTIIVLVICCKRRIPVTKDVADAETLDISKQLTPGHVNSGYGLLLQNGIPPENETSFDSKQRKRRPPSYAKVNKSKRLPQTTCPETSRDNNVDGAVVELTSGQTVGMSQTDYSLNTSYELVDLAQDENENPENGGIANTTMHDSSEYDHLGYISQETHGDSHLYDHASKANENTAAESPYSHIKSASKDEEDDPYS